MEIKMNGLVHEKLTHQYLWAALSHTLLLRCHFVSTCIPTDLLLCEFESKSLFPFKFNNQITKLKSQSFQDELHYLEW